MYNVKDEEATASLRNSNQTSSKLSHNSSYKTTQRRSRHSSKIYEVCTQTENHKLRKFIINVASDILMYNIHFKSLTSQSVLML